MTADARETLAALSAAATPGPWRADRWHSDNCAADCDDQACFMMLVGSVTHGMVGETGTERDADPPEAFYVERDPNRGGEADAQFIAAAVNYVREQVAEGGQVPQEAGDEEVAAHVSGEYMSAASVEAVMRMVDTPTTSPDVPAAYEDEDESGDADLRARIEALISQANGRMILPGYVLSTDLDAALRAEPGTAPTTEGGQR